jgi:hypothetical protein
VDWIGFEWVVEAVESEKGCVYALFMQAEVWVVGRTRRKTKPACGVYIYGI